MKNLSGLYILGKIIFHAKLISIFNKKTPDE